MPHVDSARWAAYIVVPHAAVNAAAVLSALRGTVLLLSMAASSQCPAQSLLSGCRPLIVEGNKTACCHYCTVTPGLHSHSCASPA